LHLGNGAVAVIGGVGDEQRCSCPGDGDLRGEPVAEFEIEESGGERDAAPDIYDDEDPIATAPPAEAPTTATFRAPERRRVATAVATSAACRLAFSPVGQLELPVQRRSNSRTCVDSPHDPLLREAGRDTKP
jgi:hypothetical protein